MRLVISVVCVVASVLALYNVYSDNTEVVAEAERIACGKPGCALKKIREERSPVTQTFGFQTVLEPPTTQEISCRRQFLLVGEYSCE